MTNGVATRVVMAPTGAARLAACIRDPDGRPALANLFPVLHHHESGKTWRRISYQRRTSAYIWRDLPAGTYTLRVTAAAMRPVSFPLSLTAAEQRVIEITLVPAREEEPLILRVDDRARAFGGLATQLSLDAEQRGRFASAPEATVTGELQPEDRDHSSQPRLRGSTRLLAAFLADKGLHAALTLPIPALPRSESLQSWIETVLRGAWDFHIRPDLVERIVRGLVNNRLRLVAVTEAAFQVEAVHALVPELSANEVVLEVLRCVEALDYPELEGLLPLLGGLFVPRGAVVHRFFHAVVGPFDARVPAGVARSRLGCATPRGTLQSAAAPAALHDDVPSGGSESIFTMHLLAGAMAWAVEPETVLA